MDIRYVNDGGIVTITIDREERRNALAPQTMVDLRDALLRFDEDPSALVAIVTGAGPDAFCAGADIKETLPADRSFIEGYFDREVGSTHPLYIRNIALPKLGIRKPVIAAVNGVAVGGGTEIALNCDLCIASENARFGLTEVRIGSIPAVAGIQRLLRSLPRAAAMQLLLTGSIVDAKWALQWGLVSEVVATQDLLPRAREIAQCISENAPLAVRSAKLLADKAAELSLREATDVEELLWGHLYATEDRVEGRKAFAEKRKPTYRAK
ncbi:short chain enoyl-CoA hydratase [Caballeronia catudaia]|uniref:Short chain enoyl-CoA hydratase n=1 Tax=Caballeronia catudaia TaxID=1777136 RepID=A0A158DGH4_9BURK|nr:enoyl-CoA hydratase-related protein [Caballeronia catudaia]SAK92917.1 short chain enoyl-CoA hydratase [Caballeronia catudaia]